MRRNRRNSAKKERIIMIASSAFVLTALTMTGIYMKSSDVEQQDDGYTIDFTAFENDLQDKIDEIEQGGQELARNEQNTPQDNVEALPENLNDREQNDPMNLDSDLDYPTMEVGSGQIEIPGLTDRLQGREPMAEKEPVTEDISAGQDDSIGEDVPAMDNTPVVGDQTSAMEPDAAAPEGEAQEPAQDADSSEVVTDVLHFSVEEGLRRPVSGEVLIPYSMNTTVYFSTLDQFKCSPALVLAAEQGSAVTACAEGRVVDIFENEEIGQAVTMELGDGYQITYGQLETVNVVLGSHVEPGEVIAWIAKPTKYYCVEGSNLYLKLTADGKAVDPEVLFY